MVEGFNSLVSIHVPDPYGLIPGAGRQVACVCIYEFVCVGVSGSDYMRDVMGVRGEG